MRTIAHLSDLHFGRVDPATLGPLREILQRLTPDLLVVTGDLTQRARRSEFRAAREFLDTLPKPQIVVPGNHDVPLYNLFARFHHPLRGFRRYITEEVEPAYEDEEISVIGVNTARSWTFKYGRINREQARRAHERFCRVDKRVTRIVATHHPFDLPEGGDLRELVGRARMAMEVLAQCATDIFLAGHLHVSHTGETATRYKIAGHSALFIAAGTATSLRERGEPNSFNVVRIDRPAVWLRRYMWSRRDAQFQPGAEETFERTEKGWTRRPVTAVSAEA